MVHLTLTERAGRAASAFRRPRAAADAADPQVPALHDRLVRSDDLDRALPAQPLEFRMACRPWQCASYAVGGAIYCTSPPCSPYDSHVPSLPRISRAICACRVDKDNCVLRADGGVGCRGEGGGRVGKVPPCRVASSSHLI